MTNDSDALLDFTQVEKAGPLGRLFHARNPGHGGSAALPDEGDTIIEVIE